MGEPPPRRATTMLGFARMNFAGVRAERGRYAEAAAARQGLPLLAAIGCGCGWIHADHLAWLAVGQGRLDDVRRRCRRSPSRRRAPAPARDRPSRLRVPTDRPRRDRARRPCRRSACAQARVATVRRHAPLPAASSRRRRGKGEPHEARRCAADAALCRAAVQAHRLVRVTRDAGAVLVEPGQAVVRHRDAAVAGLTPQHRGLRVVLRLAPALRGEPAHEPAAQGSPACRAAVNCAAASA